MGEPRPNVVALAISDAPAGTPRIIVAVRGDNPEGVVQNAYTECYKRAPDGFMHTCQVSYGTAWVVGSECVISTDPTQKPIVDIESDDVSPQGAMTKSVKFIARTSGSANAVCRELAEYNANDIETARSIAIDKAR